MVELIIRFGTRLCNVISCYEGELKAGIKSIIGTGSQYIYIYIYICTKYAWILWMKLLLLYVFK